MVEKQKIRIPMIRKFYRTIKDSDIVGIVGALVVMCIILTILSDKFFTWRNIATVLRTISINAMVGFGMTFVIIMGGIDLSVGSVMSLCGVFATVLISLFNIPVILAILIGLTLGTLIGTINGFLSTKLRLASFIVTLAMAYIARGFSYILTGGSPISVHVELFYELGNGYLGPIPFPVVYMIVIFIVMAFVLYKTRFGRHVYAIGGNEQAAKFSGINIDRARIIGFTLVGFLSALGGIVLCAKLYSGQPTIGVGAELDVIAAVILGGTSFSGGIGTLGGTLVGAILMGVINNGLNILGVSSFWQDVAKGLIILIAVYIDVLKKKRKKI